MTIETVAFWALQDELKAAQARIAELEAQLAAAQDRIAVLLRAQARIKVLEQALAKATGYDPDDPTDIP